MTSSHGSPPGCPAVHPVTGQACARVCPPHDGYSHIAVDASAWFDGDGDALAELDHHWGTAYLVGHPEPGVWTAQRRDNWETVTAASTDALFTAISADYIARRVPREAGGTS